MKFDQEFIKEEIRDGWKIDTNMKKVWFVQLDLLKEFDRICKKYNLTWYPIFGTLLGVIRHHGYIPWDDDVDVAMPRKDWDKFVNICDNELKHPYFLQTTLNEEQCYMMLVSLRNSDTTGNRKTCMSKRQNNGIAIDIMPLDGGPSNGILYKINRFPLRLSTVLANTYVNDFNTSLVAVILRSILRKFKIDYKRVYKCAEQSNRRYKWKQYDYITFRALADPLTKKFIE
jgi:lipopolysaccharide cholinephosphotransferase